MAEFDADVVEFLQGFLAMGSVGGGVALLGDTDRCGDGFSPLARAAAATVPQGHERAGGGPQLADGQAGIFFPMRQAELSEEQVTDTGQNQMPTNGEILADLKVVHAQLPFGVLEQPFDVPAAVGHLGR